MIRLLKSEFTRPTYLAAVAVFAAVGLFLMPVIVGRRALLGAPDAAAYVVSNPLIPMWLGALLAPLVIGHTLDTRVPNAAVARGHRRSSVMLAKLICYYVAGLVAVAFLIVAVRLRYPPRVEAGFSIPLYTAVVCGTVSLPAIIAFAANNIYVSFTGSLIVTYALQKLMEYAAGVACAEWVDTLLRCYPAYLMGVSEGTEALVVCSAAWIAAAVVVGCVAFLRRELR